VRTVAATRYVTPLREGGSLPALIEASDEGLYVLKFRGAGQGPEALVAEVIVGEIARGLGFLMPELVLVELDPALVAFARRRAAEAGLADRVRVEGGDASVCRSFARFVPADVVLLCGIFGNVSGEDIAATIRALPAACRRGANVVWTRHRRPPDATPAVRAQFAAAGFSEITFDAPDGFVLAAGRHRLDGEPGAFGPFDPDRRLFEFVGDGSAPA
jgi:hypothetical protein